MFRRIVVATDFSPSATVALHYAASLARTFGSDLDIVHAWNWYDVDASEPLRPETTDEHRHSRHAKLASVVELVRGNLALHAKGTLVEGEPDRAIVKHAADTDADLLVVGTEGRRGIAHALLGSVAERILRLAEVPVLAVPKSWSITENAVFRPKSILVPLDLGPLGGSLVKVATDMARHTHAKVTVVHAWDSPLLPAEGHATSDTAAQMESHFARWMETHAPATTPKVTRVLRRGPAIDIIEDVANEVDADLVVTATAGRGGIEHFMLGSVTERILRSLDRPVLTYRRAAATT